MASIHVVIRGPAAEPLTQLARTSLQTSATHRGVDVTFEIVAVGCLADFLAREPARSAAGLVFVSDPTVTAPMDAKVVVATRRDAVRRGYALVDRLVPLVRGPSVSPSEILAPPVSPATLAPTTPALARTLAPTLAPTRAPTLAKTLVPTRPPARVSRLLPIAFVAALSISLGFAVGDPEVTMSRALVQVGATAAFALVTLAFAAFIAFSLAHRRGLTPAVVAGVRAAGFVGGIVAGFLAGYQARWLDEGIAVALETVSGWLAGMDTSIVLGLLLG